MKKSIFLVLLVSWSTVAMHDRDAVCCCVNDIVLPYKQCWQESYEQAGVMHLTLATSSGLLAYAWLRRVGAFGHNDPCMLGAYEPTVACECVVGCLCAAGSLRHVCDDNPDHCMTLNFLKNRAYVLKNHAQSAFSKIHID